MVDTCDQGKGTGNFNSGRVQGSRAEGMARGVGWGWGAKSSLALLLPCQRGCRFRLCVYKYA